MLFYRFKAFFSFMRAQHVQSYPPIYVICKALDLDLGLPASKLLFYNECLIQVQNKLLLFLLK